MFARRQCEPGPKLSGTDRAMDSTKGLSISEHIFCQSRGDYYEIRDGKPQKDGW